MALANPTRRQIDDLNTVAAFLASPDLDDLSQSSIASVTGTPQADLLVLLGNAVVHTMDAVAKAFQNGAAKHLLLVGGKGHSTDYLRDAVQRDPRYEGADLDGKPEAEIMRGVLTRWHGIDAGPILMETQSTNCGANAVETYKLLDERGLTPTTILLTQDPTMQLRSHASFRRVWQERPEVQFFNAPTFVPKVDADGGRLAFTNRGVTGLWPMERFLALLMGEIPRLRDDAHGYGPKGRGYIAHVDVPPDVEAAYGRLCSELDEYVRPVGG